MQTIRNMRCGTAIVLGLTLVVTGCAETQLGAQLAKSVARTTPAESPPAPVPTSADPTLAPEAFNATGLTIWDGAATLQGVWFAHPLAQRAQRVRVRNVENELVVEGALFRRDPSVSGPSILVSSDAARGLGITPGAATELEIIALREGPIPRAETQVAAAPATGTVATEPLAAPEPSGETEVPAVETATPEAELDTPTPVETVEEPTSDPEEIALLPARPTPTPRPAASPVEESPASSSASRSVPSLDAIAPVEGGLAAGEYIQLGSFSVEPNAKLLVQRMISEGQPGQYVNRTINEKPFSVVVIGPLANDAAIDAAKAAAAKAGINDTIKVTL